MMRFLYLVFLLMVLFSNDMKAFVGPVNSYKVKAANKSYDRNEYAKAEKIYGVLLDEGVLTIDEIEKYAHSLLICGKVDSSAKVLKRVTTLSPLGARVAYDAAVLTAHYEVADSLHEVYPDVMAYEDDSMESLHSLLASMPRGEGCEVLIEAINSEASDYAPALNHDTLYFVSFRQNDKFWNKGDNKGASSFQDVYKVVDGDVVPVEEGINTHYHDGPLCFSEDGRRMIICRNNYSFNNANAHQADLSKLYLFQYTRQDDGSWADAERLSFCQADYYYTHPHIKGDRLYFVSNMEGGYGQSDIYYVEILEDGTIGETTTNLGPEVNSPRREGFPYVCDNGDIYFTSDGHVGLGGLDLFKYVADGENEGVYNLGAKYNSAYDDFALVGMDDMEGYFSSNREGGVGDDDVYHYRVYPEIEVEVVDAISGDLLSDVSFRVSQLPNDDDISGLTDSSGHYSFFAHDAFQNAHVCVDEALGYCRYDSSILVNKEKLIVVLQPQMLGVRGCVYDSASMERYKDMTINICENGVVLTSIFTDDNGNYSQELERDKTYDLVLVSAHNLPVEVSISTARISNWLELDFPLSDLSEIESFNYGFDQSNISSQASQVLDDVVDMLDQYPWMRIELGSHTDVLGPADYNMILAQQRSDAAKEYLVSCGIDPLRIESKAYGEMHPKNRCETGVRCMPLEHLENRRTEIKILN